MRGVDVPLSHALHQGEIHRGAGHDFPAADLDHDLLAHAAGRIGAPWNNSGNIPVGPLGVETAMNFIVDRHGGRSVRLASDGMKQRTRAQKHGLLGGIRGHLRTIRQILRTNRALERSGGQTCEL